MKHLILSPRILLGWSVFLFALTFHCAAADRFRLQLLDGQSLEGSVLSLTTEKLTFSAADGPQEFLAAQIKSLKQLPTTSTSPEATANSSIAVQLRDGSTLNAIAVELMGKVANVKLSDVEQKIPAAEVQWIRFRDTVPTNEATWRELIEAEPKSDRLVILRPGDTLDTIEGLISGMNANEVQFRFDGEEIKAPRNKLLGITFFTTAQKSYTPAKIKVSTLRQDQLAALSVESIRENDTDYLKIVTAADIALKLPWGVIDQLDFSAGNLQLAAELVPMKSIANIPQDYPGTTELAQKLFAPHAEHFGRADTKNDLPKTDLLFQGSGIMEYRVPEGMNRFQTTIAGSPLAQVRGWTTISIEQEDEVLFQQSFRPEAERLPIDVAVVPKRRLILRVQSENPRQADDAIWWLQPRFIK